MSGGPVAVFGMPLYESVDHLPAALDSLLAQTRSDLAVVVADDSQSDRPGAIVAGYARVDSRIHYLRNKRRLGLVGNWRYVLLEARRLHPDAPYFAWAGDHDEWEPRWLELLVADLDEHPEAVLAYGADAEGRWRFQTVGQRSRAGRYARTLRQMVAGDMVYGLFRRNNLLRAGGLRRVLQPDRLLLAELALLGEFRQLETPLWRRRRDPDVVFSFERQRAAIFPDGAPAWAGAPWPLTHAAALGRAQAVRGQGAPELGRTAGALAALAYPVLVGGYAAARRVAALTTRRPSLSSAPMPGTLIEIGLQHEAQKTKRKYDNRPSVAETYEHLLAPWRDLPLRVFEIGIKRGASLKMWKEYFPYARIYGLDFKDLRRLAEDRIEIFVGDQKDPEVLDAVLAAAGGTVDLVIDDGSHRGEDQQASLLYLWPHLRPGGLYLIEDIHTSYQEKRDMGWHVSGTTIEFLKDVLDDVHQWEHGHPALLPELGSLYLAPGTCALRRHVRTDETDWALPTLEQNPPVLATSEPAHGPVPQHRGLRSLLGR